MAFAGTKHDAADPIFNQCGAAVHYPDKFAEQYGCGHDFHYLAIFSAGLSEWAESDSDGVEYYAGLLCGMCHAGGKSVECVYVWTAGFGEL